MNRRHLLALLLGLQFAKSVVKELWTGGEVEVPLSYRGASTLASFNDFCAAQGPTYLTGARSVVDESVQQTYMLGRGLRRVVR